MGTDAPVPKKRPGRPRKIRGKILENPFKFRDVV